MSRTRVNFGKFSYIQRVLRGILMRKLMRQCSFSYSMYWSTTNCSVFTVTQKCATDTQIPHHKTNHKYIMKAWVIGRFKILHTILYNSLAKNPSEIIFREPDTSGTVPSSKFPNDRWRDFHSPIHERNRWRGETPQRGGGVRSRRGWGCGERDNN